MISSQFLFKSYDDLTQRLSKFSKHKEYGVQIFTNALNSFESVDLAQKIKELLPNSQIIGSSVSAVIFHNEQFSGETLIVIDDYEKTQISSHMISLEGKTFNDIAKDIHGALGEKIPKLMRLFVSGYYDYAHQLIDELNFICPGMSIVGGMSGEIDHSTAIPYVFNETLSTDNGLIFTTLDGEALTVYNRINTAHVPIGHDHTITAVKDRAILEIDGYPAREWFERNLGTLGAEQYKNWQDIADFDPLVRTQLSLKSNRHATRFVRFDETEQQITQYFSRLNVGTWFRMSYTSPAKCVEEALETCAEIQTTPVENLFCYNCLFRKLYLKNCAEWELTPFHNNPVSGVFLLGEFGSGPDGNTLLNGSCVFSGVAENQSYLDVDMSQLDHLEEVRTQDSNLMDFIAERQTKIISLENEKMLKDIIDSESNHPTSPFQRINLGLTVGDLTKYELDRKRLSFNKICLVKVENADILVSFAGQAGYISNLQLMIGDLANQPETTVPLNKLYFYMIKSDAFVIATESSVPKESFLEYVHALQKGCELAQEVTGALPFLLRFIIVSDHELLLDKAHAQLEEHKNSQSHIVGAEEILYDSFEIEDVVVVKDTSTEQELKCIELIRYAISNNRVVPYYQGLYNNDTKKIDKYEALMRLVGADGNILSPYHFMGVSKKYRYYLDLNLKMLQLVLRDFATIDCAVNINISAHDISSTRFRDEVRHALKSFHKPENLTFEILEDEYFSDVSSLTEFINEVRAYGVKIAVDDFGSGYSNLLEIAKIHPDVIKIDGQIIRDLGKCDANEAIVDMVSRLGETLSINIVAEFVEDGNIQKIIEKYPITHSQGYHFSEPQPFEQVFAVESKEHKI